MARSLVMRFAFAMGPADLLNRLGSRCAASWPSSSSIGIRGRIPSRSFLKNATHMSRPVDKDEERHRLTLEAVADVDAGRVIDHQVVRAWADRLGTKQPLPVPRPDMRRRG